MAKYGLIGGKLGHSFSSGIHEKYFGILGESSTYGLFEVAEDCLKSALEGFSNDGFSGLNVTIPYKRSVMEHLDEISAEAQKIGAVNTVKFENGRKIGYNTDYYGFGKALEKFGVEIENKRVYILGTGGAANAVYAYCRDKNADGVFVSRNPKNGAIGYDELKANAQGVLVNCTPVGMYPNIDATPIDSVSEFDSVVDLIYNPSTTKLLKKAAECGVSAVNGLYMLVAQAVCSEAIWHGAEFDEKIIDEIYNGMEA